MEVKEAQAIRRLLIDAVSGHHSHIEFDAAVEDFPAEARGRKIGGASHTAWQLLEHMRLAQHDILEFSRNAKHHSPKWPEGYWPKTEAPPDPEAWDRSIEAFHKNGHEFRQFLQDAANDLLKPFEHGDGQTLLREALVLANHNSYHLGQLVLLKKSLQVE